MANAAAVFDRLGTLADPTRTRILALLEGTELTVSELCSILQLPQSTVSRHLRILSDEGWTSAREAGANRFYTVVASRLEPVARRLWTVVRDQFSGSAAAQQDVRRKNSVLNSRRVKMHTFFTATAGQWDRVRADLIGERADLVALLDLLDPDLVVGDLGCGTGMLSAALSGVVRQVVAVDESGAMLTAARRRLSALENVDVRSGSIESLPIDDAQLDVALLFMVMHFVVEPARAFAEVRRVLRPGGRMLMLDFTSHDRDEYSLQMGHVWQGFSESQLRAWTEEAGMTALRYRELPADARARGPAVFTFMATNQNDNRRNHGNS